MEENEDTANQQIYSPEKIHLQSTKAMINTTLIEMENEYKNDLNKKNLINKECLKALLCSTKAEEIINQFIPYFIRTSLETFSGKRIAEMKQFLGININEAKSISACIKNELQAHDRKESKVSKLKELLPNYSDIIRQFTSMHAKCPSKKHKRLGSPPKQKLGKICISDLK